MSQARDLSLHRVLKFCSRLIGFGCPRSPAGNQRHGRSLANYNEQPPNKMPRIVAPASAWRRASSADLECSGSLTLLAPSFEGSLEGGSKGRGFCRCSPRRQTVVHLAPLRPNPRISPPSHVIRAMNTAPPHDFCAVNPLSLISWVCLFLFCHPDWSRPIFSRAAFWRFGPRSGGIAPPLPPRFPLLRHPTRCSRVAHPSRLVRSVGSYHRTPRSFFSSLLGLLFSEN
jgi:hypothetical protein